MRNALCRRPGKCRLSRPGAGMDGWVSGWAGGWVGGCKEVRGGAARDSAKLHAANYAKCKQEQGIAASLHGCICTGVSDSLPALLMKRKASPAASLILRPDRSTMLTLLPAMVRGARRGGRK